jgi:hypothetical protein
MLAKTESASSVMSREVVTILSEIPNKYYITISFEYVAL